MSSKTSGKILYSLLTVTLVPILLIGIVILSAGTVQFTKSMYNEVNTELANVADSISAALDVQYPGDYHLVEGDGLSLYKGDVDITQKYELFDTIHEQTGLEITLFYLDTRVITTIRDNTGKRIVGTGAPESVISDVLRTGESHFYSKVYIYNTEYFSYYHPLIRSDGTPIGMLFVGKPGAEVASSIKHSILPLILSNLIVILFAVFFTTHFTKWFVADIVAIRNFLGEIKKENLNTHLDSKVLTRNDELGDIARSATDMQRAVRTLVEQDVLTSLANRRYGEKNLHRVVSESVAKNIDFCVAIGDIDFFKKVNDTYGHACGDLVLKNVAAILRKGMHHHGFVARWGGEEFLLVFENRTGKQAYHVLEEILNEIRETVSVYEENEVRVTMTFGLAVGTDNNVTELLHRADENLYNGKNAGRNRIVY